MSQSAPANPPGPRRRRGLSLPAQIMLGLVLGGLLGYLSPYYGERVYFLRDIFLNLIKLVIAPLIFSTIVVGIASEGDLKKVGRMGVKSLVYFEIVTTAALFVGLLVVNLIKPGAGIGALPTDTSALASASANHPQTLTETIVHIFPSSVIKAMAEGDVLQIVCFSVIFAIATVTLGPAGRPMVAWCETLSQIMFRFTSIVMRFAPVGVGAAMAHTIAVHGLKVLVNLGLLVGSLYLALILFVVLVLGTVATVFRVPLLPFVRAIKEPFAVAFATTSSESALPKAMENMQRLGVPKRIVSFVMPTGYSFNLDGTTLYLAIAGVFVAQAAGVDLSLKQQLVMLLSLMVTSKGVAAVPRASLVILLGTVGQFNLPVAAVALILGVDEFMDMARTSVNVLGNCLATVVIARSEREFDDTRAAAFGTPAEIPLDLAAGEPALAIDAAG